MLEQRCAACHNPGQVGADIWSLETAADAAQVAPGLGLVTSTRFMPPWPASDVGIPLQHSTKLTDEQVATIAAWADAGGPLDVDPATLVEAAHPEIESLRRDLEMALPVPFEGSTARRNDYRCMILDPNADQTHLRPGHRLRARPDRDRPPCRRLPGQGRGPAVARRLLEAGRSPPGLGVLRGHRRELSADPHRRGEHTVHGLGPRPGPPATRRAPPCAWTPETCSWCRSTTTTHTATRRPVAHGDRSGGQTKGDIEEIEYALYLAPAEIPCSTAEKGRCAIGTRSSSSSTAATAWWRAPSPTPCTACVARSPRTSPG